MPPSCPFRVSRPVGVPLIGFHTPIPLHPIPDPVTSCALTVPGNPPNAHYGDLVEFQLACSKVSTATASCVNYPAEALEFSLAQLSASLDVPAPRIMVLGCVAATGAYRIVWTPVAAGDTVRVLSRGNQIVDYSITLDGLWSSLQGRRGHFVTSVAAWRWDAYHHEPPIPVALQLPLSQRDAHRIGAVLFQHRVPPLARFMASASTARS